MKIILFIGWERFVKHTKILSDTIMYVLIPWYCKIYLSHSRSYSDSYSGMLTHVDLCTVIVTCLTSTLSTILLLIFSPPWEDTPRWFYILRMFTNTPNIYYIKFDQFKNKPKNCWLKIKWPLGRVLFVGHHASILF